MTNQEFKYWLLGFYELSDRFFLDDKQIKIIKNHAALVKRTVGYLEDNICIAMNKLQDSKDHKKIIAEIAI